MLIISPFPAPQDLTMNVRQHGLVVHNDGVCVCDAALKLRNNGVGFRDTIANVRNSRIYVRSEFSLGTGSQRWSYRNNRTHIKDKEDLVEVRPPAGDCLAIVLRMGCVRGCIPFAPPDDPASDVGQGPMTRSR